MSEHIIIYHLINEQASLCLQIQIIESVLYPVDGKSISVVVVFFSLFISVFEVTKKCDREKRKFRVKLEILSPFDNALFAFSTV